MKIGAVKAVAYLTERRKWIYVCPFHIYCPVWVKCDIRSTAEVWVPSKTAQWRSYFFLWSWMKLYLRVYCETVWNSESRERLRNIFHYATDYTYLPLRHGLHIFPTTPRITPLAIWLYVGTCKCVMKADYTQDKNRGPWKDRNLASRSFSIRRWWEIRLNLFMYRVKWLRGLCDELVPRPEESYRLWCV
jgi:hypothetical protein